MAFRWCHPRVVGCDGRCSSGKNYLALVVDHPLLVVPLEASFDKPLANAV
jgi:hypothetical protein